MPTEISYSSAIYATADQLHENWRQAWQAQNGADAPRWKPLKPASVEWLESRSDISPSALRLGENGVQEINIAALPNSQLPPQFSAENIASAKGAIEAILENPTANIDEIAATVHKQWLERNGSWAPDELKVDYSLLSEAEKEKDRVVVAAARDSLRTSIPAAEVVILNGQTQMNTPTTPQVPLNAEVPPPSEVLEAVGLLNKSLKYAGLAAKYLGPVGAVAAPVVGTEEGIREAIHKGEGVVGTAESALSGLGHGAATLFGLGDGIKDVTANEKLTTIDRSLNAAEHLATATAGTLAVAGLAQMATGVGIFSGAVTEALALGSLVTAAGAHVTKGVRKAMGETGQDQDGGVIYNVAHYVGHLVSGGEHVAEAASPAQTANASAPDKVQKR